jgi:cullin-4
VGKEAIHFLTSVHAKWQEHCEQMAIIRGIFLFLDRTHVLQHEKVRSLWDMSLEIWSGLLQTHYMVERRCVDGLLQLIEKERVGEVIDRALVKQLLRMLCQLQVYGESFETRFLQETTAFYRKEGDKLMEGLSTPDYLSHANLRISQERERVVHYLDDGTWPPLLELARRELVKRHVGALLEKGFGGLMEQDRRRDLHLLFTLFQEVEVALSRCLLSRTCILTYAPRVC